MTSTGLGLVAFSLASPRLWVSVTSVSVKVLLISVHIYIMSHTF